MNWNLKNDCRANGKSLPVSGNDFPDALVSDGKIETKQGRKGKPDLNKGRYNSEDKSDEAGQDIPAVAYVRMSTDHQKYSTENQLDIIRDYATARGLQILRVFEDSGRSGLRLDGREALQNLMAEVRTGQADFKAILVYDVSRWGRFQDADEGAYHEHVCSRAGIRVHYCGEQFENDGSIGSNLLKTVKRVMAGEYSRELSVKVFAGQCRLVELGYRQGGAAGYGLRRVLIDEHGNPKGALSRGQQKSFQTDRVVLVPGPEQEQDVVRRMYRMFVEDGRSEREIAETLNAEGHLTDLERQWSRASVHQVLTGVVAWSVKRSEHALPETDFRRCVRTWGDPVQSSG